MACDVCGSVGTPLEDLRECYQTKDVRQVCPTCASVLNKHLDKLRTVTSGLLTSWFSRFIAMRRRSALGSAERKETE